MTAGDARPLRSVVSVWILGDQLLEVHPAIREAEKTAKKPEIRIVLVESSGRARRLPYQRKKLVLLFSAMRHYAESLRQSGFVVDYIQAESFITGLRQHVTKHRSARLLTMASASYGGRMGQLALEERLDIPVQLLPNTQLLTGRYNPIPEPVPERRYVMENFYRALRRHFDVLMDGDEPVRGQWNFDRENRKRLPEDAILPPDSRFEPDKITQAVMSQVAGQENGVGTVAGFGYAVTREQAKEVFQHFLKERLQNFGAYEDALSTRSHSLYHSQLSPYLNLGLLEPLELVRAAEQAYVDGVAPLNSVEGFIRQILGWREFMYWQYWRQMPGMTQKNAWGAYRSLPEFVWTGKTDMACMHHVLNRALSTGYNHHIERLMILGNFFMLTGIDPKAVNDWFLSVYIDAYEWVMPANVIGMALNADDGLTATKPYIASANYINKMGDFCAGCRFNPRQRHGESACPYNFLYWNFILQHEERLRTNPRTSRNVLGLRYLTEDDRIQVQEQAATFMALL